MEGEALTRYIWMSERSLPAVDKVKRKQVTTNRFMVNDMLLLLLLDNGVC